mmetsp:Transcript_24123/g.75678  ORF Transcript_24123/g.75678 Transcript_24123/m.75678 type:complete len:262 (+) Transcript_24123:2126-2911(+)
MYRLLQPPALVLQRGKVPHRHGARRAERDGGSEALLRLHKLPQVLVYRAQVGDCVVHVGLQPDRLLVARHRLRDVPRVAIQPRKAHPCLREALAAPDGLSVAVVRPRRVALGAADVPQVAVHIPEVGVYSQRGIVPFHRLGHQPFLHQHAGEVIVCVAEGGPQRDRILVVYNGHVEVAHLLQRVGHVGVRLGKCRVELNGRGIERQAFVKVAQLIVDGPQEEEHIRSVHIVFIHLLAAFQCPLVVSGLVHRVCLSEIQVPT